MSEGQHREAVTSEGQGREAVTSEGQGRAAAAPVERWVRRACGVALAALGLIVWSMLDPRPLPVIFAMSLGQVLGTLSLSMFGIAIIVDLHRRFVVRTPRKDARPPDG